MEGQYFIILKLLSKYYPVVKCINHPLCFHNILIPNWWEIVGISLRPSRPHLDAKQAEMLVWKANIIFIGYFLYNRSKWSSVLIIHLHYGSFITSFFLSSRKWKASSQGHLNEIFNTCQIFTRAFFGIVQKELSGCFGRTMFSWTYNFISHWCKTCWKGCQGNIIFCFVKPI